MNRSFWPRDSAAVRHRCTVWPVSLGLVAAAAVLWLHPSPCAAQPSPPPTPSQNFWERIYDPHRDLYLAAIDEASAAWLRGDQGTLHRVVDRLVELRPNGAGTLYFRALVLSSLGDHAQAVSLLESIVDAETVPEEVALASVYADLAVGRTRLGRWDDALAAWELALDAAQLQPGVGLAPDDRAIFLSNMAELEVAVGRPERGVSLYREALLAAPEYTHGLFGMAAALEHLDAHEQARAWLLAAILQDPTLGRTLGGGTFFVPDGERAFRLGQVQEEVGRFADAVTSYQAALDAFARLDDEGPLARSARQALARVEGASPTIVARGAAPLRSPTAVAADPTGHHVAFGDALGRVVMVRLDAERPLMPIASGPAVDALAYDASGRLLVAREDGFIREIEPDGRLGRLHGPLAVPSGTQIGLLSADGAGLLSNTGRQRLWGLVAVEHTDVEIAQLQSRQVPQAMALGPLHPRRRTAPLAMWSGQAGLTIDLVAGQGAETVQGTTVPGEGVAAMAFSRDGRWLVAVGTRYVTLSRTSDLRVLKILALADDGPRPTLLAIDEAGAAGLGPVVLVVYPDRFTALRWSAPGEEPGGEAGAAGR